MGEPSINAKTVASYLDDVKAQQAALQNEDNELIRAGSLDELLAGPLKEAMAEADDAPADERTSLRADCLACAADVCAETADCFVRFASGDPKLARRRQEAIRQLLDFATQAIALDAGRVDLWLLLHRALRTQGEHAAADAALAEALRSGVDLVVVAARKEVRRLGLAFEDIEGLTFDRDAVCGRTTRPGSSVGATHDDPDSFEAESEEARKVLAYTGGCFTLLALALVQVATVVGLGGLPLWR